MSQSTRLAVVIPTRNRSDLASQALRSVLQSEGSEAVLVIVSDNSTDPEEAEKLSSLCGELARRGHDKGLLYIRPDDDLSMSEHWEWARKEALTVDAISHLMYLTDRSVLKPWALSALISLLEQYPEDAISYNAEVVLDAVEPVRLRQEDWSAAVLRVSSDRLLSLASEFVLMSPLPRMLNTVVPRSAFASIVDQFGTVFAASTAPDFAFCWRLLALVEDFLFMDRPAITVHALRRSNGASTTTGVLSEATKDFLRLASETSVICADTLLPAAVTTSNVIAQEYVAVALRPGGERLPALNRKAYMRTIAAETDSFMPGPLKSQNATVLQAAGVTFGRLSAARRSLARSLHFVKRLGLSTSVAVLRRRLRWRLAPTFPDTESAIERAACCACRRRTSLSHLRYLKAEKGPQVECMPTGDKVKRQSL